MEKRVSYFVAFVCKPYDLNEVKAVAAHSLPLEHQHNIIAETVLLSAAEYDSFVNDFFQPLSWLNGKGGRAGSVLVKAPGRASLVVNPEGYNYARYVALAV